MTRRERKQLLRTASDIFRMVPLAVRTAVAIVHVIIATLFPRAFFKLLVRNPCFTVIFSENSEWRVPSNRLALSVANTDIVATHLIGGYRVGLSHDSCTV